MRCELCGGPGPVQEFGLADGDIVLCAACFKKSSETVPGTPADVPMIGPDGKF